MCGELLRSLEWRCGSHEITFYHSEPQRHFLVVADLALALSLASGKFDDRVDRARMSMEVCKKDRDPDFGSVFSNDLAYSVFFKTFKFLIENWISRDYRDRNIMFL